MMIDNFEEFNILKSVFEDLNFSYDIDWKIKSDIEYEGYFENIKVYIENIGNNSWFFKFYRKENDEWVDSLNSDKKSYKEITNILGTIRKLFINFVEEKNPNLISFIAIDKSKSRKYLYHVFLQQIVNNDKKIKKISYIDNDYELFAVYKDKEYLILLRKFIYEKFSLLF